MEDKELYEILEYEKKFPYLGITKQTRDYCLDILKHCKDICDSDNKVNGSNKCNIVEMHFEKEKDYIKANGSLIIGKRGNEPNNKENNIEARSIDAHIYLTDTSIIVDMQVDRIMYDGVNKTYTVSDEFKLENGKIKRRSQYNYDMKSLYDFVDDEQIRRELK